MRRNRKRRNLARQLRRIVGTGALVVAVALVGVPFGRSIAVGVLEHPYFALRTVRIDGLRVLDDEAVLERGGVSPGASLWSIDPGRVRTLLLRHSRIQSVSVEREFPDQLIVRIEERRPAAVLLFEDGPLFVDGQGAVFPPLPDEPIDRVPIVTGIRSEELEDEPVRVSGRIRGALRVLAMWKERHGWPTPSEVRPGEGEVRVFPEALSMTVRFGAGREEEQFSRLSAIFDRWRGREHGLASVDLSVPGQVILRVRSGGVGEGKQQRI